MRWIGYWLVVLGLLAGCVKSPSTPSVEPQTPSVGADSTPAERITVTPTTFDGLCAYVWAYQPLPQETLALNKAVRAAGFTEVESQATAYGENCIDSNSNAVVGFTAKQTDFYFDVVVADATDTQVMGQWTVLVMQILEGFQPGIVPGINRGQVNLVFQDGTHTTSIDFAQELGYERLKQGLRGSALYEALLRKP